MAAKVQTGFLILADISGFTFFLANTELDHATIALSYLLETIVEKMGQALTISKLEGDAVLAYVDDNPLLNSQAIWTVIDHTYRAFRERADTLHQGATCPCRACRALPSLDLKFLVHYGDFIIQQVAGTQDLLGSDVNLVHRLAKNRVVESTGWRGYALFTLQGVERLQADKTAFVQQWESYEHLGSVETYVVDMQGRYKTLRAS
jgi:class 3 adenylate cyclase